MIDAVPIEISAKQLSWLPMTLDPSQLPDDITILKAMVIAGGREIAALKLTIAKMRRDKFGASSERGAKLLDQLELQLAELEEGVAEDIATAQIKSAREGQHGRAAAQTRSSATASASPARTRRALPTVGLPQLRWGHEETR